MIEKLGKLVGWSSIVFSSGIMIGIILALFPASKPVSAQVTCYSLTLVSNPGAGGMPTASPINSNGCNPNEYVSGEHITLDPGTNVGYVFDNWFGETTIDNTFVMPASNLTLTSNYINFAPQYLNSSPFTDCTSQTQIDVTECDALSTLYNDTSGSAWKYNTEWLTTNTPCSWYGVSCGGGHVTGLSLGYNNLVGALTDTLFDGLPYLYWLYLNNNSLTGSIPSSIGSHIYLGRLYLQ